MIYCCVTSKHGYTFRGFFKLWGRSLRENVCVLPYEKIPLTRRLPNGVYVFTDFERLLEPELAFVKRLYYRLSLDPDRYTVINNPSLWLNRFDLLQRLFSLGVNTFRVYRANEIEPDLRFPIFLRRDNDHAGSLSKLLYSFEELEHTLQHLSRENRLMRNRLMIVEYSNTEDLQGVFRKYSVMNIYDNLIPRHVLFSTKWVTKCPDITNEAFAQEENQFVEEFPHQEQVKDIFRLAGVEYGRIDYGMKDGKLQVWEINTNPIIVPAQSKISEERLASQRKSVEQILRAFKALESNSPTKQGTYPFPLTEVFLWKTVQMFSKIYGRYRR